MKVEEENTVVSAKDINKCVADNSNLTQITEETFNIEDNLNHRGNIPLSPESSDFESSSDDDDDDDAFFINLRKNVPSLPVKAPVVRRKEESHDLPPVEDLFITEEVSNLQKMGKILHTIVDSVSKEFLVITESDGNISPLDEGSALFLSTGEPLGKIDEVLGKVNKPSYTVRFNNAEEILKKNLQKGQDVFYSPKNDDLTHYVMVDHLKKQKGSDASWKDNVEPPDDQIDYSDDELEKRAKPQRKAKNRREQKNCNSESNDDDVTVIEERNRPVEYNRKRSHRGNFPSTSSSAVTAASPLLAPPRFAVSYDASIPTRTPSFSMPASQHVPPQHVQQGRFRHAVTLPAFLPHPPPTLNTNQNSRTFMHPNIAIRPTFGAALNTQAVHFSQPAILSSHPFESTSHSPLNYSANQNLNFLQHNQTFTLPTTQPLCAPNNVTFSAPYPARPSTYPIRPFVSNQSQCQTPSFISNQPPFAPQQLPCQTPAFVTRPSPSVTPSYVTSPPPYITSPPPCPTPPYLIGSAPHQNFPLMPNHPLPVLPNQTLPNTVHPFVYGLPVVRNPMPPQQYPY